jgi:hypothetical protein
VAVERLNDRTTPKGDVVPPSAIVRQLPLSEVAAFERLQHLATDANQPPFLSRLSTIQCVTDFKKRGNGGTVGTANVSGVFGGGTCTPVFFWGNTDCQIDGDNH